jgi:hypothetical protein
MSPALIFLVTLLAVVVLLNWRFLAASFGKGGSACDWSRIHQRDRDGKKAWFCPSCGREAFMAGKGPPPDCGATYDRSKRK